MEGTTSAQQTSAVDGRVVGQTDLDAESGELVSISSSNDDITLDLGVEDLADDVGIGDADNEAVLGSVVLVLVLDDQALASIVISLSLTAATILDLVAFEVSFILLDLDERLKRKLEFVDWDGSKGDRWMGRKDSYHYEMNRQGSSNLGIPGHVPADVFLCYL